MKRTVSIVLAGLLLGALLVPVVADDDDDDPGDAIGQRIAAALSKVKLSLADACAKAEKETGGKAVAGKLEIEDEETAYEVVVAVVVGKDVTLRELDIDAMNGKILENEVMGSDDDDDAAEDNDGDDDGDDDHDDDGDDDAR